MTLMMAQDELSPRRRRPAWQEIERAATLIDAVFTGSPVAAHAELDAALGCHLTVKVETLNPIRSFKGRGASWFIQTEGLEDDRPLVAASAGNFGQGLAYAATRAGRSLKIFAATTANPGKITAMRRLGADLTLEGADFDAAKAAALEWAQRTGARLVIDGNEPTIAEGAGTIALELTQHQATPADAMLIPLGNGALATGVGTWLKHAWPDTEVIAVAASGAPSMALSFQQGAEVSTPTVDTIADGMAVRVPEAYALETMIGTVDDVTLVDDEHIVTAMQLVHRHLGLVVEPAGAGGIAALLQDPARWANKNVVSILCGANIDHDRASGWLYG
jgi:threonine dehydratase